MWTGKKTTVNNRMKSNLFQLQLNTHLEEILSKQCQLEARLRSVGKAINSLNTAKNNAGELSEMINHTSELSESVSKKVRKLDEARVRDLTISLNCLLISSCSLRTAYPSVNNAYTT